jgi:hypothetical protein
MDKKFTPEHHAYLRKSASEVDSSGMERGCQKVLIKYGDQEAWNKREKDLEKARKVAEKISGVSCWGK